MFNTKKLLGRLIALFMIIFIVTGIPVASLSARAADRGDETDGKTEEEAVVYATETLRMINTFDYYTHSVSPLSEEPLTSKEISQKLQKYGTYLGTPGMPDALYREAMEQKWEDATDRKNKYETITFDLKSRYTYNSLVNIMVNLSRIDGVNLYRIGKSSQGRAMYALEVDIPSDEPKDTVIITGTIHARETAGATYIIKELVDLLQNKSHKAKETLKRTRFIAVPCVNPDGRDGVCFNPEAYSYSNKELWKATGSGTDLNRNFPGLSWGQLASGNTKSKYIGSSPTKLYYPGPYAGSAPETRAMMKLLYHYIVLEKASMFIDYHQQGRIMYVDKPWCSSAQRELCKDAADHFKGILNEGQKKSANNKYTTIKEDKDYGLNGVGSTMTDYACSIANGSKYSRAYGFNVYCTKKEEYPLIMIPRLDNTKKKLLEAPNNTLVTFTFEIGWGNDSLGYSSKARSLIADEYKTFHYDKVLYELSAYAYEHRK